jgi:hypothetical protein
VVLTPLEIVFNKPHPSILLHIPDATTCKVLISFYKRSNVTLSTGGLSYKSLVDEKSYILGYKPI